MNFHIILILVAWQVVLKSINKAPYLYSNIGISLIYQVITVIIILNLLYNINKKNIIFFIKVFKPIKVVFFKIKFNKALLFNKIATIHITAYTLGLSAWLISILIPIKLNYFITAVKLNIITSLGVFWSAQEVLWEGFWNWNLIEISILLVNIFVLSLIHKKIKIRYLVAVTITSIYIYWYFNHYPLKISIHNFTNNKFLKITNWLIVPVFLFLYFNKTKIYFYIIIIMWYLQLIKLLNTQTLFYKSFFLMYYLTTYVKNIPIYFLWNINFISIQFIFFVVPFFPKHKFYNNKYILFIHSCLVTYLFTLILFQYIYSYNKYFTIKSYFYIKNYPPLLNFNQNSIFGNKKILGFNNNFKLICRYRTILIFNYKSSYFYIT